jgi:hypothetical protein
MKRVLAMLCLLAARGASAFDYDGDGQADPALYQAAAGAWHILGSQGGSTTQSWGWSEATPVPADYDGDGRTDLAVYHPAAGNWYIRQSAGGNALRLLGLERLAAGARRV